MSSLNAHSFQRLDQALQRLYVHSTIEEFPGRLLESVRDLVGSEVTCFTEIGPGESGVINIADPASDALQSLLPVLAELQEQHPRVVDFIENGTPDARTVSDYISKREWHSRDLFHHFYGALGLEDQLTIMVPTRADYMIGLALNRTYRGFDDADRQLLNMFQPHLAIAWENSRAVSAIAAAKFVGPDESAAVIRLTADGVLWFATPAARRLLRSFYSDVGDGDLPHVLRSWIRARIRGNSKASNGADRYTRRERANNRTLDLRLMREPEVEGWILIVVENVTAIRTHHALAPRLRRVLDRLLLGESEKEVGLSLSLSQHTVHGYVKELYRQFGVSSRAELMARWVPGKEGQ